MEWVASMIQYLKNNNTICWFICGYGLFSMSYHRGGGKKNKHKTQCVHDSVSNINW